MSDDALTDDLVRYQILSKVTPGKIMVVDELGKWDITEPSSFQSGVRSLYSLVRSFRFPPSQRKVFLTHLERTTNSLISHCKLQMETRVFDVCIKQMQASTQASHQDIEKFDQILFKLRTICKALHEGMKGLETLCKTTTYQKDVKFAGEIEIGIVEKVKRFFQQVFNAVGPHLAKVILGDALNIIGHSNLTTTTTTTTNMSATLQNKILHDAKEAKETKEIKETKETKEIKDMKDMKEGKANEDKPPLTHKLNAIPLYPVKTANTMTTKTN